MANFTFTASIVDQKAPVYAVQVSRSKNFKPSRNIIDDEPIKEYALLFRAVDETARDNLLNHFNGQYGPGKTFTWTTVPADVDGGVSKTVAYSEKDGYKQTPVLAAEKRWDVWITFIEEP